MWELPKERNATSEVICINNNVTNFIATLEALDFPRSAIFSLSDLESTGERSGTTLCQSAYSVASHAYVIMDALPSSVTRGVPEGSVGDYGHASNN